MKIERLERRWPGSESALEFGPMLNIVLVDDEDQVPGLFDATITALSGPARKHAALRRPRVAKVDELDIKLGISRCDGRRLRIERELTARPGQFRMFDADTDEPILALDREGRSDLLAGIGRTHFEALVRVRQGDIWSACSMGLGVEQVFRRNASAAGATASRDRAAQRARALLTGGSGDGANLAGSPLVWARAREVDLGRRISDARRLHSEASSARASLRRSRAALESAEVRAEQALYFALIAQQSSLLARVAKLRSLDEEIRRLTPAPLGPGASEALRIAPQADRLIERINHFERTGVIAAAGLPEPSVETRQLETRLNELELALEPDGEAIPFATTEIDPPIRTAYEDWRRLCAETAASEFAAEVAHQDAAAMGEPSPGVARLARVTTADRLRARLTARTAALRAHEAAQRHKASVIEKLAASDIKVGELLERTRIAREPIALLASVEDAHAKRVIAEEHLDSIRPIAFRRRRQAKAELTSATANEAARLAAAGYREQSEFAVALEAGFRLIGQAAELANATAALAGAAADLRAADDEVSSHASGAAAEQAARLLGDLEAHQNDIAAAEEIRQEAQLAISTAASLRASREAASNELLARIRPFGIHESDPARGWSIYKLAVARTKEREALMIEMADIEAQLSEHRQVFADVMAARDGVKHARSQLKALIGRIPDCRTGSFGERFGDFTRLRDEALLEQKLESARVGVADEFKKALEAQSLSDWEARLISVESKLSDLEERHSDWCDIEVTGSADLLIKAADDAAENLRRVRTEVDEAESRVAEISVELPDISELTAKLTSVRAEISRLEDLGQRLEVMAEADTQTDGSADDLTRRSSLPGRSWKLPQVQRHPSRPTTTAAANARAQTASAGAASSRVSARSDNPSAAIETHNGIIELAGSAALQLETTVRPDLSAGHRVEEYLTARYALLAAWGPADEHLPMFVEDIFSAAGKTESRSALDLLSSIACATQVIVVTTVESLSGLSLDSSADTLRVINAG